MAAPLALRLPLLGLLVLSHSVSAWAQSRPSAAGYTTVEARDGYGVIFRDDPLAAGGLDANAATITVRQGAFRVTLIRPRTAFVVEMLKSVENL